MKPKRNLIKLVITSSFIIILLIMAKFIYKSFNAKDYNHYIKFYNSLFNSINFNQTDRNWVEKILNYNALFENNDLNIIENSECVELFADEKDGRASGIFSFKVTLDSKDSLFEILNKLGKINSQHLGEYNEYHSVYLNDYLEKNQSIIIVINYDVENKERQSIKIAIQVKIPYRYKIEEIQNYSDVQKYFLELNEQINYNV